jgi:hypothetical protein
LWSIDTLSFKTNVAQVAVKMVLYIACHYEPAEWYMKRAKTRLFKRSATATAEIFMDGDVGEGEWHSL